MRLRYKWQLVVGKLFLLLVGLKLGLMCKVVISWPATNLVNLLQVGCELRLLLASQFLATVLTNNL